MSANLADLVKQVADLSFEELLTLQEQLIRQLRVKSPLAADSLNKPPSRLIKIPGAYQVTVEEIEASFAATFSPEELAEMDKVDLDNLPTGPRSLSEMVNEDREDRF